nr:branched-chain amino acid transport system II carrier protein [uncultured Cellulosilyticum sp.]
MKEKRKASDMWVIGFALFAMFFGSGNLIFPSYLGRMIGSHYLQGLIGFMITGIGLPLLSVMATAKAGGEFSHISHQIGKVFSVILMTFLILSIGPFLAIPRTAATTYEIGIRPFFPTLSPLIVIIIYFIINLILVLRPSTIVDVIGKFLTPVLLVILLVLIIKGILVPIGPVTTASIDSVFSRAIIEGYQTMDALGAVCFSSIIVNNIREKGYKEKGEIIGVTLKSSLVAVVGLGVIYGGLMYLGTHTGHISGDIEKTQLITTLAGQILGNIGSVLLAIAVAIACLTTSIGLTMTAANYFSDLFKQKVSYSTVAVITSLIGVAIASMGVDRIVGVTGPVLNILYPLIIVLVVISLIESVPSPIVYQLPVYVTLIIVLVEEGSKLAGMNTNWFSFLPFSQLGFSWLVPAVVSYIIAKIITMGLKRS